MDAKLADGRSVKLRLCLYWRNQLFNRPDNTFAPNERKTFDEGIAQYLARDGKKVSTKLAQRIAANAWKLDDAVHRRIKEPEIETGKSPYLGQPEKYDPEVVQMFMDAISAACGEKTFECGNRNEPGIMMNALLCAITWAKARTWAVYAPPGILPPPKVKFEGLLPIVRKIKKRTGN